MQKKPIICLMGPTASGKTALAVQLVQHFPCDIVSVDSAMVYRGMDIGTAKPDPSILNIAPHRLISFVDPSIAYSAGQFYHDALREIEDILSHRRIPLLVGGTMLYFRALQQGLAPLPSANAALREQIKQRAMVESWAALHAELESVDPDAARRILPTDSQRIQRALEVFYITGRPISHWQSEQTLASTRYHFYSWGLMPQDRSSLHARIAARFSTMLENGLIDEVKCLYARGDLHENLPAIRSVGYRQIWSYLQEKINEETMVEQAIAATRQLSKRQMTWLRAWPEITLFNSDNAEDTLIGIGKLIERI